MDELNLYHVNISTYTRSLTVNIITINNDI